MIQIVLQKLSMVMIRANAPGPATLKITENEQEYSFAVLERSRSPKPSELTSLEPHKKRLAKSGLPLLVARYISESSGQQLARKGWSWADTCGNWDIRGPGLRLQRRVVSSPPKQAKSRLPASGRGLAVIRWLIHLPPETVSATELAKRAGVSQPRASQILNDLVDLKLVKHPTRFEWSVNKEALLEHFITSYPGLKGTVQYFYTLNSPNEAAADLARSIGKKNRALISADVAADLLAPYRAPSHLLAYQTTPWKDMPSDWVEAAGSADANVVVISPRDESIAAFPLTRKFKGATIELADPTQVLYDLHNAGGNDRIESAEVLKEWILRTSYAI